MPSGEIGRRRVLDAECGEHLGVQSRGMISLRHCIDIVDVARLDHGAFAHVTEQRELTSLTEGNFAIGPAQKHVRLDADCAKLAHRVLSRLGFEFAGARNKRHQR